MSRRYGRNQKRKARALLEELSEQSKVQKRLHEAETTSLELRVRKVEDGYKTILLHIQKTLGPYSLLRVLATGNTKKIHSGMMDPDNYPTALAVEPNELLFGWPDSAMNVETVDVHELYNLISHYERDFRGQAVASIMYRSGISCLALNEAAFRVAPESMLVSKIATDLLRHMRKRN